MARSVNTARDIQKTTSGGWVGGGVGGYLSIPVDTLLLMFTLQMFFAIPSQVNFTEKFTARELHTNMKLARVKGIIFGKVAE